MLQQAVAGNENEAADTAPTFKTLEEGSNVLLKEERRRLERGFLRRCLGTRTQRDAQAS